MPLKTPKFWYQAPDIRSTLLAPLAWSYQAGHLLHTARQRKKQYRSPLPVICVGNAVAGGSGKTPTVISLVQLIKSQLSFKNPYILTRGYGGNITQPTLVDPDIHSASDVGDESLLLAAYAPTVISPNRAAGAKFIEANEQEKQSADLILMDDGLQNASLAHTLRLLVIDRSMDFGNGKTIPAGPLREPLQKLLPTIDGVVCIGPKLMAECPSFSATITPNVKNLNTDQAFIAFAGIGRPEKFKTTLEELNLRLAGWHEFADHHPYTIDEIKKLLSHAKEKNATLITTEKDHIRLPNEFKDKIKTLPIALRFEEENELKFFLTERLST
ncbi:MAG: tetraacyldisaccharide 4'-kinase [Alphaproteobacteria bacterium]|nr:tetraacyldisaccharide 4'-kinase [Alphaproteobacteria bacterium]